MVFVTDLTHEDFGSAGNLASALNSTFVYDNANGFSSVTFCLIPPTGSTVQFEASCEGTDWFVIQFQNIQTGKSTNSVSINGSYNFTGSILGFTHWRVKVTSAGSTTGTVTGRVIRESVGTSSDSNKGANKDNPSFVQIGGSGLTSFGEILVGQLIPRIQLTFPYNINSLLSNISTANSGTVTHSAPFAVVSSGTNTAGQARLSSVGYITYRAGTGVNTRFTAIFDTGAAQNTRIVGIGNDRNGYFFGFDGVNFGVLRRSAGVDYWTYQTSWNVDKMDGTGISSNILDVTKGNVYQIKYQWLGFGEMSFLIEDPETGAFSAVHRIKYSNKFTETSTEIPSFPFIVESKNTGNNTNLSIKTPSASIQYEGAIDLVGILRSQANEIPPGKAGQNRSILSIRNKNSVFGGTNNNNSYLELKAISISNNGNKSIQFGIIKNPTSITSASYADLDTNTSIVSYSIDGTIITGGIVIFSVSLAPGQSNTINVESWKMDAYPGEELTLFARTFQNTNGDIQGSLTWGELIG